MEMLLLIEKYNAVKWVLKCFDYDHLFSESDIFDIIDIIGENDFKTIATEVIESFIDGRPLQEYQKIAVRKIVEYLEVSYENGDDMDTVSEKIQTLELGIEPFLNKN